MILALLIGCVTADAFPEAFAEAVCVQAEECGNLPAEGDCIDIEMTVADAYLGSAYTPAAGATCVADWRRLECGGDEPASCAALWDASN